MTDGTDLLCAKHRSCCARPWKG